MHRTLWMKANVSYSTRVSLNLRRERLITTISIIQIDQVNLLTSFTMDFGIGACLRQDSFKASVLLILRIVLLLSALFDQRN